MSEHPFGWLSLLPPVVAIVLSIVTRRVVISLLAGLFAGALILTQGSPLSATGELLSTHLLSKLLEPNTLQIFFFTILMGMMVGVINRAAGMRGLVNLLTPLANSRRRGQLVTWMLGLVIFFDDYANTLLLGKTMRPLTDKLKISREKLAYIVDSTAAPVAGLALISTWIAGEIGFVQEGLDKLPVSGEMTAYGLFVASIPYRFYILWTLVFVALVGLLGRDFGPMLKAERRVLNFDGKSEQREPSVSESQHADFILRDPTEPAPETKARWFNAAIPIFVTVTAVVILLYTSGGGMSGDKTLMEAFGDADSYASLLWGAFAGLVAAFVLIVPQRIAPLNELSLAAGRGAGLMLPALVILWLAQTLSTMTGSGSSVDAPLDHAAWMQNSEQSNEQIAAALTEYPVATAIETFATKDFRAYELQLSNIRSDDKAGRLLLWNKLQENVRHTSEFLARESIGRKLVAAGFAQAEVENALQYATTKSETYSQSPDDEALPGEQESLSVSFTVVEFRNRRTRLYTGDFLAGRIGELRESNRFFRDYFVQFLPTIVFLLAGIVAFSTGTSWGTMGIVMPLVIPLAYAQLALEPGGFSPDHPILLASIGSVLAGAIFGDHCSPISDTTVLSSQASDCNHAAHVLTQLPYAVLVAAISILFGTLPLGFGFSVWLLLPAGVIVMLAFLLVFGKRSSESDVNGTD